MADDGNKGGETSIRGNGWEVVSLNASTFSGPRGHDDDTEVPNISRDAEESARALFMSDHFVFPPSQHENLPLETDRPDISNHPMNVGFDLTKENELDDEAEEYFPSKPDEDNWNVQNISETEDITTIQFYDKDEAYSPEADDLSHLTLDPTMDVLKSTDLAKQRENDSSISSGLPCEAWWRRSITSLCKHAKDANAVWSIFVAATLMGLVILGHRWQQERWKIQHLRWHLGINDEKFSRMLGRLKNVFVGSHRRSSLVHTGTPGEL